MKRFWRARLKSRKEEACVFFLPSSVDVQDLSACRRLFRRAIHQIEEIEESEEIEEIEERWMCRGERRDRV